MLASRYGALLFDLDGVLYRGDEPVPHARETMATLRETGTPVAFLTNNSSRTPEHVAAKLEGLGIPADTSEVVTSALATAELLASRGAGTAFVVGMEGIRRALTEAGLTILDGAPERVDHVVIGLDTGATYAKLRHACVLVQRGAHLIATNPDGSLPVAGTLWPGAGALLAVVTETTGAVPEIVGKPFAPLFEVARARAGGGVPLVIGDRLDTDVAGAERLGWDSLLVLSGVSSRADLTTTGPRPTYVAEDLRALIGDASPEERPGSG